MANLEPTSQGNHWFRRLVAFAALALTVGCGATGTGETSAKPVAPSTVARTGSWTIVPRVPLVMQRNDRDCGAAALAAVLGYWQEDASPAAIAASTGGAGAQLRAGDLESYARSKGLSAWVFYGTMGDIVREIREGRPVIVGVGKPIGGDRALAHYEVVVGVDERAKRVLLLDPATGWTEDGFSGFAGEWARSRGVALVVDGDRSDRAVAPRAASALGARYAAREARAPEARNFRGGDVIVISASALALVLAIILIIVLI